ARWQLFEAQFEVRAFGAAVLIKKSETFLPFRADIVGLQFIRAAHYLSLFEGSARSRHRPGYRSVRLSTRFAVTGLLPVRK
ncbi:MAG TPA: hypothetical protein VJ889_02910, partial [Pseudomonas sp.]|nr:hypothetical protein [Pseudomonas sp.]